MSRAFMVSWLGTLYFDAMYKLTRMGIVSYFCDTCKHLKSIKDTKDASAAILLAVA